MVLKKGKIHAKEGVGLRRTPGERGGEWRVGKAISR